MIRQPQDSGYEAPDSHEEEQCDSSDCGSDDENKGAGRRASSSPEFVDKTCFGCRLSKVKCDKFFPCGRCTRMGVKCVEQTPKLCALHFTGQKKYPKKKRPAKKNKRGRRAPSTSSSSNSSVSSVCSTSSDNTASVVSSTERPTRLRSKGGSASSKKPRCDDVGSVGEGSRPRGSEAVGDYRHPFMSTAEQRRSRLLSRDRSGSLSTLPSPGHDGEKKPFVERRATHPYLQALEETKQPPRDKGEDDDQDGSSSSAVERTPSQVVLSTFFELRAVDHVDPVRASNVVKSWAMSALRYSRKPLMASVKAISDSLGIDLRQVLDSPHLTALDPDKPSSIPEHRITPFLHELYSAAAPTAVQILVHGESRFFCNQLWSESFFTEDFGNHAFTRSATLLSYDILGIAVAASDREDCFQACGRLLFGSAGEMSEFSQVLKCHDVGGNDFMALVRLRICVSQDGYYHGTAMSIQALPDAKYIDWNLDAEDGFDDVLMGEGGPLTLDDEEEEDERMMMQAAAAALDNGYAWLRDPAAAHEATGGAVVGDWPADQAMPINGACRAMPSDIKAMAGVPQGDGPEQKPMEMGEGGHDEDDDASTSSSELLCREDVQLPAQAAGAAHRCC